MITKLETLPRLKKSDVEIAAEMLSRAFHNDPLIAYFFSNEEERLEDIKQFYLFRLKYGIAYGEVYIISPKIEGLAIWIHPSNITMTNWQIFRAGGMKLMRKLGRKKMSKMFAVEHYISEIHYRNVDFPHWHLSPVAVDPVHQGKGYASKLIRAMLERFDNENIACFLETQVKKNVEIYKRYDFKVVEKGIIPEANLEHWAMIRLPKNKEKK